jgi:predicted RNA-binding Zn-ribbon protein involved in translation (DUF1610 family)
MKFKKLNDILGKNQLLPIDLTNAEIDPTEVIEHYFFERGKGDDYRQEAIEFMMKNKITFNSTCNSNFNMAKKFIKVDCPTCGKPMKYEGGSGSSSQYTHRFVCKSKRCPSISITIPSDGITVNFPE